MQSKTKIRSEVANNPHHQRDMKIRTGVRAGGNGLGATIASNPLYQSSDSSGSNPLFDA